jgi:hypothetical protein
MSDNIDLGKRAANLAEVAQSHRSLEKRAVNALVSAAGDQHVIEVGGHVSRHGYDLTPASARQRVIMAERLHVAVVTLGGALQLAHPHQAAFFDLHIRALEGLIDAV